MCYLLNPIKLRIFHSLLYKHGQVTIKRKVYCLDRSYFSFQISLSSTKLVYYEGNFLITSAKFIFALNSACFGFYSYYSLSTFVL